MNYARLIACSLCLLSAISATAQDRAAPYTGTKYGLGFNASFSSFEQTPCLGFGLEAAFIRKEHFEWAVQGDVYADMFRGPVFAQTYSLLAGYRKLAGSRVALSLLAGPHFYYGNYYVGESPLVVGIPGSETERHSGFGFTVQPRIECYAGPHVCMVAAPFLNLSAQSQAGISVRFLFGKFRPDDDRDRGRRQVEPMRRDTY